MPLYLGDTQAKHVYLGDTLIYEEQPKANAVYYKPNGTGNWLPVTVTWNTDHYEASPATNPSFIVALTTDGQEPAVDMSNIKNYYQWTAGSSFGIIAISEFTASSHGDGVIYVSL